MNENLDRRTLKLIATANQLIKDYAYTGLDATYKAVRAAILNVGEITSIKKLRQLERAIAQAVKDNLSPQMVTMTNQLTDISELEAAFYVGLANEAIKAGDLDLSVNATAKDKIQRYVEGSVIKLNSKSGNIVVNWAEYVERYEASVADKIKSVVRSAWLQQSQGGALISPSSLIKQVKNINELTNKRNAESIVRTAVNHFGTQGRLAFADDNSDVIEREIPIVTFDSRVSDTCISISANYGQNGWPYGKSPVGYPPYHPNCRTQIGFLLIGQDELYGTRQSVGGRSGSEAEESFERREKRSDKVVKYSGRNDKAFKSEQIPANTPIAKFLREQPRWYVEEVLGKKKADAFLNGELSLGKLTDADLKPRTVQQLGID